MTTALKNTLSKINKLTSVEQNAIASLLNEELKWQQSFYKTQDALSLLANEAITEYRSGKTQKMDLGK